MINIPKTKTIASFHPVKNPSFKWDDSGSIALTNAIYNVIHERIDFHRDELLGISSVAFCNYFYHPGYNQHEEEQAVSLYSNLISNYGIVESIAHYTGISIAEVNGLVQDEFWKLLQFEVLNGRALVSMKEDFSLIIIEGYREEEGRRHLLTQNGEQVFEEKLQGEDPIYSNWALLIRDGGPERERTSLTRQRTNLLKWVVRHGFEKKEFSQETRENYACGIHALELLTLKVGDRAFHSHFSTFIEDFLVKKSAASRCLALWSGDIAAETNIKVEPLLKRASKSYQDIVDLSVKNVDWPTIFPKMVELEREALASLQDAAVYFPSAFG